MKRCALVNTKWIFRRAALEHFYATIVQALAQLFRELRATF